MEMSYDLFVEGLKVLAKAFVPGLVDIGESDAVLLTNEDYLLHRFTNRIFTKPTRTAYVYLPDW